MFTAPSLALEPLLSRLPLFNGLGPQDIARIARGTREIQAIKGSTLFRRGDPCEGFYVVVYGHVKLAFLSPRGEKKAVEIVGRGQSFGEAPMFTGRPYALHCYVLSDSQLLHVAKSVVFEQLERDPVFGRKMLSGLSAQLHQMVRDVESYSLHSGAQRVIGYLLREIGADEGSDSGSITLEVRKGAIASRLNLTKEHFSRILHDLAAQGLIIMNGRSIQVPALADLRAHMD